MKSSILNFIINSIKKYYDYDEIKLKEIRYGLESIYLSIVKLIVILIISIFIHTTKELCLLIIFYGILRLFAFGLHTKNSIECWILSILIFSLFPYLIKKLIINNIYLYIVDIILFIFIIIYAPADTEKRPLINERKRKLYKLLSIFLTSIYLIIICLINSLYIKKLLTFSILLEVLLILPISYKLLGLKYNNYLRYSRKEDRKWNFLQD